MASGTYILRGSAGSPMRGRPLRSGALCLLLASSSVAALLIGGGTRPAVAACSNVVGPGAVASYTNPTGTTIPCVTFSGATVSGNVVNAGTITPGASNGITFSSSGGTVPSTIHGSVSNSGTISVGGTGIFSNAGQFLLGGITNTGTISGGNNGIEVVPASTFAGGITNTGSIKGGFGGIVENGVFAFNGGITNAGTITAGLDYGIEVIGSVIHPVTFVGNISNSGTITAGLAGILVRGSTGLGGFMISSFAGAIVNTGSITGVKTGIQVFEVTTFTGGITNNGMIVATSKTGILVSGGSAGGGGSTFAGGIVGTGTISAGTFGIKLTGVSNFSGGISSGSIAATADTGISVTSVSTFGGGITSSGSITAGKDGIFVNTGTVSFFNGDIVNNGTITPGTNFAGIELVKTGALFSVITLNGNVTNNGTITASGTGNAIDVRSNVINGGIVNNGTLSAAAGAVGAIAINVRVFGTSAFGIVNSATGNISSGGVAAVFIEANTFLGGITNAGTISAPNGAGIDLVGAIGSTFSGGITNSGTITAKTGIAAFAQTTFSGPIVNTGNITGTGLFAIDAGGGVSAVTVDQEAGTIAGTIDFPQANADTLNVTGGVINGNITGAGTQIVNFGPGFSGTYGGNPTYAITGINALNIASGTIVLDATANSATDVTVSGGVLQVGDAANSGAVLTSTTVDVTGGTLSGHGMVVGAVTIGSGATLAPGGSIGTLTIAGSVTFNSSSNYDVEINDTTASKTLVNGAPGTATINGGTVVVTPEFTTLGPHGGTTYTIVTATGGRTGTFAGVVENGNFTGSLSLTYDLNDVFLNVGTGFTLLSAPSGANQNEQNVLNGINNFILNGGTPPGNFQNLNNLSNAALLNALTQIDGEAATGAKKSAFQLMTDFFNLLSSMGGGGGGGGAGGTAPGFADEEQPGLPPDVALAYARALHKAPPQQNFDRRWSIWGAGFGGSSTTDGNAVVGSNNVTATDYGYAAGMTYHVTPATDYGFALGGGGTNWNLAQGLGGGRSDSFEAGLYGTTRWGPAYLSGALAFANHWFDTNRIALGDSLTAKFDGQSYGARAEAGYRYGLPFTGGAIVGVTPYAALQAQAFHTPGYSETDLSGGGFGLTYNAVNSTDTRSELGARFDNLTVLDGMPLVLRGRLAWAHDWVSNPSLGAVFQALPGSNFTVNGAAPPANSALTTAGGGVASHRQLDGDGEVRRRVRARLADLRRHRHA